MPFWVQCVADVIPLTHFLKAFRILIIENGDLSQTVSAIRNMVLIAVICGIASYVALYFKRKAVLRDE
jgi:ABC-2 type transport system permease protein